VVAYKNNMYQKSLISVLNRPESLANVNSHSRSLYAICYISLVRRASVCNAHAPYSAGWNFRQFFCGIWYVGHPLTSMENFTEIVPGEPLRRGFKRKRGCQI